MTLQLLYSEFPYTVYEVNLFLFFITAELLNSNSNAAYISIISFDSSTQPNQRQRRKEGSICVCVFSVMRVNSACAFGRNSCSPLSDSPQLEQGTWRLQQLLTPPQHYLDPPGPGPPPASTGKNHYLPP